MNSLRSRFVISHILPIFLTIPLVAFALIYIIETQVLMRSLSQNLTESALVISQTVENNPLIWEDPEAAKQLSAQLSFHVEAQILLITPAGDIIAYDPDFGDLANQELDIQGLSEAQQGQTSINITYGWFTQTGEVLVPVFNDTNNLVGIVGLTKSLEGAASDFSRLRNLILSVLVIELALAIAIGLAMAINLEKPIRRTIESVIEIAYGMQNKPLKSKGPREILQLEQAVNFLSKRLINLEQTRQRLLANLVHELGRPLGAMAAAVNVLQGPKGNEAKIRKELLDGIESELTRMQPMLDDLAQLHGQVLGTFQLNKVKIDISEWLISTILPWRAHAIEKGLLWKTDIQENLPVMNIDPDRMAQVVGNLLSNAIKYTPTGGTIELFCHLTVGGLSINIRDNGPGIPPEEQKQVFEPFFRSSSERRFPEGLGLGLSIAREITIAHGGDLTLQSDKGAGSTFTIYLPIEDD